MNALAALRGTCLHQVSLAKYTSWRVGGQATQLYCPADVADLAAFLAQLPPTEPLLWLGLGSNLLVRDGGFVGTVILTRGGLAEFRADDDGVFHIGAGVACAKVAKQLVKANRVGGEFWAGIPGTFGGALAMNAGAWGGTTWDWVTAVDTVDRGGQIRGYPATAFSVGYRHVELPSDEWFVRGTVQLPSGDGGQSALRIKTLLQQRNLTQPTHQPSGGSVFRNPPNDHAARLIDQAGLKGLTVGDAQISLKHANFIVNRGRARAADIEQLIHHITATVADRFGVVLQTEVRIVGQPCPDLSRQSHEVMS